MAIEGHYIELTDQYDLNETESSITCTRVFTDGKADGTASLPEIGDVLDASDPKYQRVKVVGINKKKYGKQPNVHIWTVSYTNSPAIVGGMASGIPNLSDSLPVNGSLGGEFITVDGTKTGSGFTWYTGGAVNQQIPKKILTSTFKISRRSTVLPLAKIFQYAGCINSSDFLIQDANQTIPAGLLLFEGITYEQFQDNDGDWKWQINFSFNAKYVPISYSYSKDGVTYDTWGGWLFLLNETSGIFDMVSPNLYQYKDLGKLMGDLSFL